MVFPTPSKSQRLCQSPIGSLSNTKHAAPKCFPCNTAQLWRQHGNTVAIHYLNPPLALWDANVHGPCDHERHPWQTSVTSSSAVSGQITSISISISKSISIYIYIYIYLYLYLYIYIYIYIRCTELSPIVNLLN